MKRGIWVIAGILAFSLFLQAASATAVENLREQRWQRWRQQSVSRVGAANHLASSEPLLPLSKSLVPQFNDVKVNDDGTAATFSQRFSDVAYSLAGKGVVVWEDERNGDWDVYAQILNSDGTPFGSNQRLAYEASFLSQRQPRVAVDSGGKLLIIWVEEESASLYARLYSTSLIPMSGAIRLNDNLGENLVNLPAVAPLPGNRFVVVWEDSRDGANIYGQILDNTGNLIGGNFQINSSVASPYRIAPDVGRGANNDFAVVWEDAREGSGHVYFRIFSSDGTPLYPDLKLEANFPTAFQFNPQVRFLPGNAYFVAWISDRYGGQSVFGQLVSATSALIDTSFQINPLASDVCWDVRMAQSPDSGVACLWANFSSGSSILLQKISRHGIAAGSTRDLQDNVVLRERAFPSFAFRAAGAIGVWVDQRNINQDIYAQLLDVNLEKIGGNFRLNDDQTGSQQSSPDITRLSQGNVAVAWHDQRSDFGDIIVQRVGFSGTPIGLPIRVNDDPGTSLQANPRIGSAANGEMVVVWEDRRTAGGIPGQSIFCQRLAADGSAAGANFLVNDDFTSAPKSQPDIAVGNSGNFVIVWTDERSAGKEIYLQRFNSSGAPLGTNRLVAAAPEAAESFAPHVGLRGDDSFVVTFLSIVGARQVPYFQRFDANGTPAGPLQLLAVDTSGTNVLESDVFVHDYKGSFNIATIESAPSGSGVKMYRYDFGGNLLLGNVIVSDVADVGFQDLRIAGDIDDGMIVTWSDLRSGIRRGYYQLMREDGFHIGSNSPIRASGITALEGQPAAVLNNGYFFCAWVDNRNAGRGFDVFLNSAQYTSTDADDLDFSLPRQFTLEQNYPNPFNPLTTISYTLARPQSVRLMILSALGRQVKVLVDEYQPPGTHQATWDATASSGEPVASGVYFYRLSADELTETRKMILLK